MKVLLVSHYFSTHRGGIEAVAHRLAEGLLKCADDIAIDWMASDCDAAPRALPVRLRCIPAASWNGIERALGVPFPLWSPDALCRLRRAVRECDVVHLHDTLYIGNVCAFLFARMAGKPVLVTQHVGAIPYRSRALRALLSALNRTLARFILSRADKVLFVSPAVQRYFAAFCSFRSTPVYAPNGVDGELYAFADAAQSAAAREAAGRDPRRPLCLFVGRFVERKGIALVLSVARQLQDVGWIVAGDGSMRPEDARLRNVAVVRGLQGADIARLYRMADLLVLPSTGEGFPLVVQEAMACGTPVLVSPETAAGCPDAEHLMLTEDVAASDAAARWGERIRQILGAADELRAMRAQVAHGARLQWSWEASAKTLARALREVLAARCGR